MNQRTTAPPVARSRVFPRFRRPVIVRAPAARGRRARQDARRAVLWGAFAIALANAALSVALETVLPQVRDPEYGVRMVRLRAQQRAHPDRPLVVMVGTSRTQNGIDPAAMPFPDEPGSPLVFNFGQSGTRPVNLRLNLQRIRAAGVRPTAVLVEILPTTLGVGGPLDAMPFAPERYTASDLEWLNPYLADPAAARRRWAAARVNPWPAHGQAVANHLLPEWQPWAARIDQLWTQTDARGFGPYQYETTTNASRSRRRAEVERESVPALRDLRVSALAGESLRGLVADCRAWGVPVAFYQMPESPVYRSWYSAESRAEVAAFERVLRDELGCPVFPAPTDFAEDDFADGHHMLRPAAAKYSRWLAGEHLQTWLAGGR